MPRQPQKDNQTLEHKVALRKRALATLKDAGIQPVVMETHGGHGAVWKKCYSMIKQGVVFEIDPLKIETLVKQRATWAVYEANCVDALAAGAGAHLSITLLDIDPYGSCIPVVEAFMTSQRPFAPKMVMVTNDGQRHSVQLGKAWHIHALKPYVQKYGNDLHPIYKEVLQEVLTELAAKAGYRMTQHVAFYAGYNDIMCHSMSVLERT